MGDNNEIHQLKDDRKEKILPTESKVGNYAGYLYNAVIKIYIFI